MLHDPRHDKQPSIAGFALFVASRDPGEWYNWQRCAECAVGQYLTSIGMVPDGMRWDGDLGVMNNLAQGPGIKNKDDWTFGKLADRILEHQMTT